MQPEEIDPPAASLTSATRPVDTYAMLNAMTVDLEDWGQSVIDPRLPITPRIVDNLRRVLDLLDAHGVRATFFALGKACEVFPGMLPTIAAAGHEVGSHGYGHELVYHLTPEQFRRDLKRSIAVIESQIGVRPIGYRAPAFSVTALSLWAPRILAELGFEYSSSVFPIRKRRYGLPDAPPLPYRWPGSGLLEFPITTCQVFGRRLPIVGGGYTRLIPVTASLRLLRRLNREGRPGVVYLHPYELAPGEVADFRRDGVPVRMTRRLTQELWRSRVRPRLERLMRELPFGPMSEVLGLSRPDASASATFEPASAFAAALA